MASSASPTVRRRRLAAELRRLRGNRRAAEVVTALGWSTAKISRYEQGRGNFPLDEVSKLLDFYAVPEPRRGQLLALAAEASQRGWWEDYAEAIPPEYMEYIGLEAEASSSIQWAEVGIPGLLQTEEYARELHRGFQGAVQITPGAIGKRVRVRMIRQQLLTTRNPPLELSVVLDESTLLREIGDPPLMRAQLLHLAMIAELPNVELRIRPLIGGSSLLAASFQVFGFSAEGEAGMLGDVVSTEGLTTYLYIESETDTFAYRLVFQKLVEASLSPEESRHCILETAMHRWA